VKAVRAATDGGPDLIIDGAGGETFAQAIDAARPGGRVVSYGAHTGAAPELAVRRIFWKQLDVVGTTMGSPDDFHAMMALLSQGGLHPVVDTVFPLAEVAAALHRMDEAAQFGKIVLRIS
jgi:NADPH:quinone reductase-like Zn-dependent oxidoreductase